MCWERLGTFCKNNIFFVMFWQCQNFTILNWLQHLTFLLYKLISQVPKCHLRKCIGLEWVEQNVRMCTSQLSLEACCVATARLPKGMQTDLLSLSLDSYVLWLSLNVRYRKFSRKIASKMKCFLILLINTFLQHQYGENRSICCVLRA